MSAGPDIKEADLPPVPLMSEEEFAQELKHSLLILSTSSPDKREIYRGLFSSHGKKEHHAGLELYYTDSGALGIAPRKTAEMTNTYKGNLWEKAYQQLLYLQNTEYQERIRLKLDSHGQNFKADEVNIVGMTEDSGWSIDFKDDAQKAQFIDIITREMKPKLRERDSWLLDKLHESGFPGPNLKPIQEHLEGGFHALMEMIYDAADEMNMKEIRYKGSNNVCFVSPRLGKMFAKEFVMTGHLLTREEYEARLLDTHKGEAINSNFVHVPDDQAEGKQETLDVLIRKGIHSKSTFDLPASYTRREVTEYLQGLIGKRRSSRTERDRSVNVAWVDPDAMDGNYSHIRINELPPINDLKISKVTATTRLRDYAHLKPFHDADAIVLIPKEIKENDNQLHSDPNYRMLLNFVVTAETDPESMGVPLVLDNRTGRFDKALELISDAFAQGRLMGDTPFYVANTTQELEADLRLIKDIKQRAPIIKKVADTKESRVKSAPLKTVPNDGVFTVFIGGGHANNSKRDLEDAKSLGYKCAANGWRIVTGGGSIEGSMGATHTGFIQYHLDRLQERMDPSLTPLVPYIDPKTNRYDAETIIKQRPEILEKMAEDGLIPRDMFYAYSMKPLLEMESPSGEKPPAITYYEAGNRVRRIDALLAPGTKIFMHGGIGTDEEFEETVKQHVEARLRKKIFQEIKQDILKLYDDMNQNVSIEGLGALIDARMRSLVSDYARSGIELGKNFKDNICADITAWQEQRGNGTANDNTSIIDRTFSDGTPDDGSTIIIYNKPVDEKNPQNGGRLDKLLAHYGLLGGDPVTKTKRKMNNIQIVTSLDQLAEVSKQTADTWLARTQNRGDDTGAAKQMAV